MNTNFTVMQTSKNMDEVRAKLAGETAITEARKTKDRLPFINDLMRHIKDDFDKRTRHCCNCTHFDEPKEICRMYKVRPPARVIVVGCKDHISDDEIPF